MAERYKTKVDSKHYGHISDVICPRTACGTFNTAITTEITPSFSIIYMS